MKQNEVLKSICNYLGKLLPVITVLISMIDQKKNKISEEKRREYLKTFERIEEYLDLYTNNIRIHYDTFFFTDKTENGFENLRKALDENMQLADYSETFERLTRNAKTIGFPEAKMFVDALDRSYKAIFGNEYVDIGSGQKGLRVTYLSKEKVDKYCEELNDSFVQFKSKVLE